MMLKKEFEEEREKANSYLKKIATFEICEILRVHFLKTTYSRDCGIKLKMVL